MCKINVLVVDVQLTNVLDVQPTYLTTFYRMNKTKFSILHEFWKQGCIIDTILSLHCTKIVKLLNKIHVFCKIVQFNLDQIENKLFQRVRLSLLYCIIHIKEERAYYPHL